MRENVWNFKWLGEILRVNLVIFGVFGPSYMQMSMVVAIYNPIFWWYATYTLNIRAGVVLVCELGWCRYSKNVNLSLVRSNAVRVKIVIFGVFGPSYVRMSMVVAIYNPIFWQYATHTLNIRAGVVLVCELGWCRYSKNVNLSLVRSNAVRVKMVKNEGCRKWIKSWFLERSRWVEHRGVIFFWIFLKIECARWIWSCEND